MLRRRPLTGFEYALIGLLAIEPRTGYALRQVFETTPMGHYGGGPGAIYPALRRLALRKLIRGNAARARPGRAARRFAVTTGGRKALHEWLLRPVTTEDAVWREEELALRFAFLDRRVTPRQTRLFLESYRAAMQAEGRRLARFLAGPDAPASVHGRLALRLGADLYATRARWAGRALRAFAGGRA